MTSESQQILDFADDCRRQSALIAQADLADSDLQSLMDAALSALFDTDLE